jgi:hypothetical protein
MKTIEYRVRPVTRYIVTRFTQSVDEERGCCGVGSEVCGEFVQLRRAETVAEALARGEAEGDKVLYRPSPVEHDPEPPKEYDDIVIRE